MVTEISRYFLIYITQNSV